MYAFQISCCTVIVKSFAYRFMQECVVCTRETWHSSVALPRAPANLRHACVISHDYFYALFIILLP
jgi:hypothetical protein